MGSTASVYTRSTAGFLDEDLDEVEASGTGFPLRVNWRVAGFDLDSVRTAGIGELEGRQKMIKVQ